MPIASKLRILGLVPQSNLDVAGESGSAVVLPSDPSLAKRRQNGEEMQCEKREARLQRVKTPVEDWEPRLCHNRAI